MSRELTLKPWRRGACQACGHTMIQTTPGVFSLNPEKGSESASDLVGWLTGHMGARMRMYYCGAVAGLRRGSDMPPARKKPKPAKGDRKSPQSILVWTRPETAREAAAQSHRDGAVIHAIDVLWYRLSAKPGRKAPASPAVLAECLVADGCAQMHGDIPPAWVRPWTSPSAPTPPA